MTTVPALIIFDCDGTLIDSEVIIAEARAKLARSYGLEMDSQYALTSFRGTPTQRTIDEIRQHLGYEPEGLWEEYLNLVFALYEDRLQPVDGAIKTLTWLQQHFDGKLAVGTSGPREMTHRKLAMTGLDVFFKDAVFTVDDANGLAKPAPDIFLCAAKTMGDINPSDCLVVEDTPVGVIAARNAMMPVVAYTGCSDENEINELIGMGLTVFNNFRDVTMFVA
jgi:HAD superfamily hydrolase (TIGR01509 family)